MRSTKPFRTEADFLDGTAMGCRYPNTGLALWGTPPPLALNPHRSPSTSVHSDVSKRKPE